MIPAQPKRAAGPRTSRPNRRAVAAAHAVAAWLTAALVAGCRPPSPTDAPRDDRIVVALPSAPVGLDPRLATDQSSQRVYELIFDGLVERAPSGELVPSLAERWELLDGGRRWRFHLRQGVRFHDGRPFSSRDVAFTLGSLLSGELVTGKRAALATVRTIETPTDDAVDLVLDEPFAALLPELTAALGIVPAGSSVEEVRTRPIGTGPFRYVSGVPELVRVELAASPDHWRGAPLTERVIFREVADDTTRVLDLLAGSVDLIANDIPPDLVPRLRADPRFQVVESPSATFAYVAFNFRVPALADLRVRRAIALAIDRPRLVATLWRGLGVVSETPFPTRAWGHHDGLPPLRHDPDAARRLLDEAGYPDPDGPGPAPRLQLTLSTSTNEQALLQAQVLQAMLGEVGIELSVRSLEFATFLADVGRGSFQLFTLFRTGAHDPHLLRLILHSQSAPPAGQNRGFFANAELDRLIEAGARAIDPAERLPIVRRAQEVFAEQLPYVVLFIRTNVSVMPRELEGYVGLPGGELRSLRQMRWRRP